ncbi:hypothetical protein FNV43_RR10415 [Rhamnella rubrinervis]|uniref:3-oxo-5-alpha-steroid 4-dehydrogenase C-terminal domain-containing protein n=1 Tax=Rhamnella rubrinervis TaxID=2594499 RepID=A0A8K0HD57_9ROSA|nr:hypothetical protein FNV43_RR10415 [Rhamnella rubrinervis]
MERSAFFLLGSTPSCLIMNCVNYAELLISCVNYDGCLCQNLLCHKQLISIVHHLNLRKGKKKAVLNENYLNMQVFPLLSLIYLILLNAEELLGGGLVDLDSYIIHFLSRNFLIGSGRETTSYGVVHVARKKVNNVHKIKLPGGGAIDGLVVGPTTASTQTTTKLPSRTGMLLLYVPVFLAPLMSLVLFPHEDIRVLLLSSALAIHFFKRVFEVLFVHNYSGGMVLDSVIQISSGYFLATTSMIYGQHLTQGLAEPAVDLKYYGVVLFLIGITGNFYHHYILSQLRRNGEKEYKIPKGGLFGLVICPHYLFEIIGFLGFSFISQTLHAFSVATGAIFYLLGRSCATRRWYISKFEDFPQDVKALIPYVF